MITQLEEAIKSIQNEFSNLNFKSNKVSNDGYDIYSWPKEDEDIIVTVHRSNGIKEEFHRHDYFYFNYTYKGEYESLSLNNNTKVKILEDEIYAGQPYAGHALFAHDNEVIIIGILIKKEVFFTTFLQMINDSTLLNFFLDVNKNKYSNEFIHVKITNTNEIRLLLELILIEYYKKENSYQDIIKTYTLSYLLHITRYLKLQKNDRFIKNIDVIINYIHDNISTVTLNDVASYVGYHPNYISNLIHKELGISYSKLINDIKMKMAQSLLNNTNLTTKQISIMLGYSNKSNFFKNYKKYYGMSPRLNNKS